MKRPTRYAALAVVLGLTACLDRCRDDKREESAAADAGGGGTAAASSVILAARQQGAFLPPELADPRYADESTLPMGPFQLPPANFSSAGTETEPNNTRVTATPIGQGLAIRGDGKYGDYDYFVFETTGEPEMWAIEATGKSIGNVVYETAALERTPPQRLDSITFVIPNIYLLPGKHSIAVHPSRVPGPYTLRAMRLGKPDLRMEREPNDLPALAHTIRFGIPRVGTLLDRYDADAYAFSLGETGRVLLTITSPPDMSLSVNLYRSSGAPNYLFNAKAKGESVRMDLALLPGEYIVVVRSGDKGSLHPYKIRAELADPFSQPSDREPNNDHTDAAPLPSDHVLQGQVGEYGDADWYVIPPLPRETSMRFGAVKLASAKRLDGAIYVVNRTTNRNEYLKWVVRDTAWEVRLPANTPIYVQIYDRGEYHVPLSFNPGIPATPAKAPFTVALPQGPHLVEAFAALGQRQSLPVTLNNTGKESIQISLEGVTSNSAWSITPQRQTIALDGGKQIQVPLELNISPDAAAAIPVQIAVRASSSAGDASATTTAYALCGATPVNGHTYSPLPNGMLGGLNLAATALGARPVAAVLSVEREKLLYDGLTPSDATWFADRPTLNDILTSTVELAGNRPALIAGITLTPGNGHPEEQVNQFEILVSEDGQAYTSVMKASLRLAPIEQAFAFVQPARAHFAQLKILSNHKGRPSTRSTLGEWKVIAVPGEHPFPTPAFNIGDRELGGHVVWSQPIFGAASAILSESIRESSMRLDAGNPNEWVVGFRHNRAAQISRLEWLQPALAQSAKVLTTVDVSVSTESPIGPWTPVGTWKIAPELGSTTPLPLAQPVWARFVRFTTTEPQKAGDYWQLAEAIRIYERPSDPNYRSMMGEWGHYSRAAIYERTVMPAMSDAEEISGNGKRDDAKKIESGKAYRGRVMLEEDEDWYRFEMPKGQNRLSLKLQGDPMLRAVAAIHDESGNTVKSETTPGAGGFTRVEAIVEGGQTYFVKLLEPPRSIAVVFDNSASLRNFSATLYRGISRFTEAVQPRREFMNLMAFQDFQPKWLLPNWSDQPYVLQGAVQNYDRIDGSSNAEFSLLSATQELEKRQGAKAVLFLTDAASGGYLKSAELWAALSRVAARVFAVEIQLGNTAARQQQLMQDWASANDGHYSTFRTPQDLDMAFERASCYMRRAARYTMTVETRFEEPPGPGAIEVALAPEIAAENAVEIILDASGSMLQRMGNQRRMDVARTMLVELVEKTLPAGTPFAFRAFGTRMANCESDLLQRLQPLDPARTGAMVRKLNATNMAKTPIGASLKLVAEDLKGVKGRKTVVLLTDGEETCGGDPAESIRYLKEQGLDVGVNIVGFAVDDSTLKVDFGRWAELGGGRFFDAKNGQELSKALTDAMRPKFQVTDATGSVVAEGTAGGASVELPVGTYTVRVLTSPVRTFDRVGITSKQTKRIEVKGAGG